MKHLIWGIFALIIVIIGYFSLIGVNQEIIQKYPDKTNFKYLQKKINLEEKELKQILKELELDGLILKTSTRYIPLPENHYISTISLTKNANKIIFYNGHIYPLNTKYINSVILNDTVSFTINEKKEAIITSIIDRNLKMLHGVLPSYDDQIKKAVSRNDLVSINHRTSAFIESYFDIIFALNKMTHPGEKKLINICKEQCKILPNNFEENLTKLFSSMYSGYDFETLADIVYEITKTVKENI